MVDQISGPARVLAKARTLGARARRRLSGTLSDVEIGQLRAMKRAYDGAHPPEILMFGDSSTYWVVPSDTDQRSVVDMLREEFGASRFFAAVGPNYNPRIMLAFLKVLAQCEGRPTVVLVPGTPSSLSPHWYYHPVFGYKSAAEQLDTLADRPVGRWPRTLAAPSEEDMRRYDVIEAESLAGLGKTMGELREWLATKPTSKQQHLVRARYVLDYAHAYPLQPDTPGVELFAELVRTLRSMEIESLCYLSPTNVALVEKMFGEIGPERIMSNADLVVRTFKANASPTSTAINMIADARDISDFGDLSHLAAAGRRTLAARLIEAVKPYLEDVT